MSAAAKLMIDSATVIHADAAGEMRARVDLPPIAIASSVTDSWDREVAATATSATATAGDMVGPANTQFPRPLIFRDQKVRHINFVDLFARPKGPLFFGGEAASSLPLLAPLHNTQVESCRADGSCVPKIPSLRGSLPAKHPQCPCTKAPLNLLLCGMPEPAALTASSTHH